MGNILNLINIKTVVAVLIVAILVAAIPVTTRLTQKQTQLKSRAASNWQCNTESGEYRSCLLF
jgi:type II secretory pathway pseudopilin PulG